MNFTRRQTIKICAASFPASLLAQPAPVIKLPFPVVIPEAFAGENREEALRWLLRSANAVTDYLGVFPAPNAIITLVAAEGEGIRSGLTFDGPPPGVRVTVGTATSRQRYLTDWVMVHEMVHLAISRLPRRHNWFHEGAATYVEIIARARSGLTSREEAWGGLLRNLHNGLPESGERGLDGTTRWGRTYWGGALFFLLADFEIRRRTSNRLGLQDALAGLVRAGSNYGEQWGMTRTLQVADSAVGTPALSELYLQMKDEAVAINLPELFGELGLQRSGSGVTLVEGKRAAARRAILPEP